MNAFSGKSHCELWDGRRFLLFERSLEEEIETSCTKKKQLVNKKKNYTSLKIDYVTEATSDK